jgi:DNA-binding NarL/FixJ family response regulator
MHVRPALRPAPKVLVADDSPALMEVVTSILVPHFDVVAAVGDGEAALEAAARTKPDLVVLDISMPRLDGIRAAKELKRRQPETEIVFLTGQEDDEFVSAALDAGARGYVIKRRLQTDLLPALDLVHHGQFFISSRAFKGISKDAIRDHSCTST